MPAASYLVWTNDWLCGVPLIVVNSVIHVAGLGLINRLVGLFKMTSDRSGAARPIAVVSAVALLATLLHGFEASIWAAVYVLLGAIPDFRDAMLFSLNAITTYGHDTVSLGKTWRLMGALEALNGLLMFGLTTAFMFFLMHHLWPALSTAAPSEFEARKPGSAP